MCLRLGGIIFRFSSSIDEDCIFVRDISKAPNLIVLFHSFTAQKVNFPPKYSINILVCGPGWEMPALFRWFVHASCLKALWWELPY